MTQAVLTVCCASTRFCASNASNVAVSPTERNCNLISNAMRPSRGLFTSAREQVGDGAFRSRRQHDMGRQAQHPLGALECDNRNVNHVGETYQRLFNLCLVDPIPANLEHLSDTTVPFGVPVEPDVNTTTTAADGSRAATAREVASGWGPTSVISTIGPLIRWWSSRASPNRADDTSKASNCTLANILRSRPAGLAGSSNTPQRAAR